MSDTVDTFVKRCGASGAAERANCQLFLSELCDVPAAEGRPPFLVVVDVGHSLELRVLDPACGTGNFLDVTLEQLKRLEGEVFDFLDALGERQAVLEMAGEAVDPHQFLGLEINPRPADWPPADYVIGNPPFIGPARMRDALGAPVEPAVLARTFVRATAVRVCAVLDTLVTLGHACRLDDGRYLAP